jgi:hypothetical protein
MKNHFFITIFLFLISTSFCRENNYYPHYVVKQPGQIAPYTRFDHNVVIPPEKAVPFDEDVWEQERRFRLLEIEMKGRIPYQESRQTVITPTSGSNSNR